MSNEPKKSSKMRVGFKKDIIWIEGDSNLKTDVEYLRKLLSRLCRQTRTRKPSCLQTLTSKWTLSSKSRRQAVFCVHQTEEKLLAARCRVGSSLQLIIVGSASKHGVLGDRVMILQPTNEWIEPISRDGQVWRRSVWRVCEPFSSKSTHTDRWPRIVRLLSTITPEDAATYEKNNDRLLESDSDTPLSHRTRTRKRLTTSSGSDEDIPLCQLRRQPSSKAVTYSANLEQLLLTPTKEIATSRNGLTEAVSTPRSSDDNKDYHFWTSNGLARDLG